jgi:hypothetical protein
MTVIHKRPFAAENHDLKAYFVDTIRTVRTAISPPRPPKATGNAAVDRLDRCWADQAPARTHSCVWLRDPAYLSGNVLR